MVFGGVVRPAQAQYASLDMNVACLAGFGVTNTYEFEIITVGKGLTNQHWFNFNTLTSEVRPIFGYPLQPYDTISVFRWDLWGFPPARQEFFLLMENDRTRLTGEIWPFLKVGNPPANAVQLPAPRSTGFSAGPDDLRPQILAAGYSDPAVNPGETTQLTAVIIAPGASGPHDLNVQVYFNGVPFTSPRVQPFQVDSQQPFAAGNIFTFTTSVDTTGVPEGLHFLEIVAERTLPNGDIARGRRWPYLTFGK